MIKTNKLGRKYEPETLEARRELAKALVAKNPNALTEDILTAIKMKYNGVGLGAGTITDIRVAHGATVRRGARRRSSRSYQRDLPLTVAPAVVELKSVSKAVQFAMDVAAAGGRCVMDLNSEKLEVTFR